MRRLAPWLAGAALAAFLTACSSEQPAAQPTTSAATPTITVVEATPTTDAADPPGPSTSTTSAPVTSSTPPAPLAGVTVVVDPGHNGANARHRAETNRLVDAGGFQKACNTTGTAAGGLSESRYNFEVSLTVRGLLEAAGATVVMTRQDDEGWGPCIDERGQTAARARADLLISIHADGSASSNHGFHIIHPAPGGTVDGEIADRSTMLAAALRDELVAEGWSTSTYAGRDGLHQRSDIGTLNRAEVPAVMLEAGNMHHAGDLARLRGDDGRQQLAAAVARTVHRVAASG